MKGLAGAHILVTGAASGIGLAITQRLAEADAVVGLMDINEARVHELSADIASTQALPTDITDPDAVRASVAQFGRPDGLVNCAGWDRMVPFLDTEPELWQRIINLNLYGTLNVTHTALAAMADAGKGRIVTIASDAGRVGSSGEAVYSACKGGLIALTKTLAREHARQGITFNAVCPGPTDTPLLRDMMDDGAAGERITQALERAVPMKRLGRPDDLAGIVAFLLSDEAAFITGQTISVSGGLTMA